MMKKTTRSAVKWLLETLSSTKSSSVEELEAEASGHYSFGEILTGLNKLLVDKKVQSEGENPIRWRHL